MLHVFLAKLVSGKNLASAGVLLRTSPTGAGKRDSPPCVQVSFRRKSSTPLQPVFSIIVPTHNRLNELGNCLRALARQRFPLSQFEVIVVDDGGSLPAGELEQAFSDALKLQVISQPRSGPATARNRGAQ